uniref:Uncharacterized protein n=1 Tax=Plectus sambesii TaxID=2011161 RepID=A0A914XW17_9BILA
MHKQPQILQYLPYLRAAAVVWEKQMRRSTLAQEQNVVDRGRRRGCGMCEKGRGEMSSEGDSTARVCRSVRPEGFTGVLSYDADSCLKADRASMTRTSLRINAFVFNTQHRFHLQRDIHTTIIG